MGTRQLAFLIGLLFLLTLIGGCTGSESVKKDARYSMYILAKDGTEYMVESNTLDSGVLKPESDGILLDAKEMDRDTFVKDGFFYRMNRKTAIFSKFRIHAGRMEIVDTLKIKDFSLENFHWINGDTLLLTGLSAGDDHAKYTLLKTGTMERLAQGNINIPDPYGKFTTLSIGLVEKRKDRLLVGYTYHVWEGVVNYNTSDTVYVSELSYPQMKLIKTEKDNRSTYPGGPNTVQSYNFRDAKQDCYFMSCPGIALGNRPDMPTGIFRIKANENKIDKSYFFDISAAIRNHAYGIWYLGGEKAIIRAERKDLYTGLNDHYSVAQFEFYILNLHTKALQKLSLPLDKGTRRECVIVQGDIAYISVNSTKEGNYIWLYNIRTGTLKKGIELAGETDFILRLDHLKG